MAQDFGNGVSRTLSAKDRQYQIVVWQANKPPLDSELNLIGQVEWEREAEKVRASMHSGFLLDPMQSDKDFQSNEAWSNWFKLGRPEQNGSSPVLYANVNGWIVPVSGTGVSDSDTSNRINLFPPPSTDSRVDFVFLEVWQAQIAPNPSTQNKPSAQAIWKYGNVEFGGTNIVDDIEDPTIGFETTERVQLQYRIRVVGSGAGLGSSIDIAQYPDGLNDPNVLAQGCAASPQAGFVWENMGSELGDPGLWRSGDGDATNALGTVDGYSYAIPICAVFRRNTAPFVARENASNANQMGGLNRNPRVTPVVNRVDGTRSFTPVTLTSDLSVSTFGAVSVTGLTGSGFDNPDINWSSTFITINGEIIGIDSVDSGAGTITISDPATRQGRGRFATQDNFHAAGSEIKFYNFRPDGKFADQVEVNDILDLRRGVTFGEWDYETILKHNLDKVLRNTLKSSYKQGNGTDTQGVEFLEVDSLVGNGAGTLPNQTERLDGFDGVRTHFSDSVVVQKGITVLLKPVSSGNASTPVVVSDFTTGAGSWDVAPDFAVSGHQPRGDEGWSQGSIIRLWIGGTNGNAGARGTTALADNKFMRFVSPYETWQENVNKYQTFFKPAMVSPVNMQLPGVTDPFYDYSASTVPVQDDSDKGPIGAAPPRYLFKPDPNLYPSSYILSYDSPFLFLGGVVHPDLYSLSATFHKASSPDGFDEIEFTGVDFDVSPAWFKYEMLEGWNTETNPLSTEGITNLLLHGTRNLQDMLTNGGQDLSGASSELFAVVTDNTNPGNNGAWWVIGAGTQTQRYTQYAASASNRLVITAGMATSPAASVDLQTVTVEVRSKYTNTQDGPTSSALGTSSAAIILSDLSLRSDISASNLSSRMILSLSVAYGPSRGGTARIANKINRFAVVNPPNTLLRESPSTIDANFESEAAVPDNETYFPTNQNIQTWSELQGLGTYPPIPPQIPSGGGRYLANMYRESELFVDEGSKTLVFRPIQKLQMSLFSQMADSTKLLHPTFYDDGITPIDGAGIVVPLLGSGKKSYAIPLDYLPNFGRQDIPIRQTPGDSQILSGINHLFCDQIGSAPNSADVYAIIGGRNANNPPDGGVFPLYLTTEAATGRPYGAYGNITSVDAYQGRLYEDLNARSSDFQKRLRGIQLPPFLGIARVYGVYDARDWNATSGSSAFQSDRATLKASGTKATNLIRKDADQQTLWILKDGASDVVSGGGAHTYIITEEAINIELSPTKTAGQTFNDFEFVVEMEVFSFCRGFIDQNAFVFARNYAGDGTNLALTPSTMSELTSIGMLLPAAMRSGHQGYVAYQRTPYQGDPYMTRDGETIQIADYQHRYGQVPVNESFQLATPIQQFSDTNTQVPEHYNCRTLEVLATLDFWTTLGTGKISGPVSLNTGTDVGYLASGGKIPSSETENPKQPQVKAFTQRQDISFNKNVASARLHISSHTAAGDLKIDIWGMSGLVTVNSGGPGTSAADLASLIARKVSIVRFKTGVAAYSIYDSVYFFSLVPGKTNFSVAFRSSLDKTPQGIFTINADGNPVATISRLYLRGEDVPANASFDADAATPMNMGGCTERLPLGILMQDSDFIGEDPIRTGQTLKVLSGGLAPASTLKMPLDPNGQEYGRIGKAGFIGMADGGILRYTPYRKGISDGGSKRFRLFRGGGSLYVLDPETPGGPVDFTSGGFSKEESPVLKGSVLFGRAYLVRNYKETAFTGNVVRTFGGEIQMVIATYAVTGDNLDCQHGYALNGYLSPTGWGEGYGASDRYRIEGKLMYQPGSKVGPDCDIFIAPVPPQDPIDDPCA